MSQDIVSVRNTPSCERREFSALHSLSSCSSMRDEWAKDFSSHFRWTDFSTNLQEFVSIRLRQSPGVVRLDSERYFTELANEVFPGGIHANYAVPARPELHSLIDNAV
eukprot:6212087-Pleurochrysis_carterae.AAC.1